MDTKKPLGEPVICLNCGTEVIAKFCPECGQDTKVDTITMMGSLRDTFTETTDYDGRIFTTLREMFLNPGKSSLAYVRGSRVRYIHPVKYFLIAMGITLIAMNFAQVDGVAPEAKINLPEFLDLPEAAKQQLANYALQYAHLVMLAFLPICGFYLGIFFKKRRTAGETTTLLFYLNGNMGILSAMTMALGLSGNPAVAFVQSSFVLMYSLWAILVFFESSFFQGAWRALVAYVCYSITIVVILTIGIKIYGVLI
ncbi:MAG: DUF3667 domain-containing protein [Alteromonadaceae bacterium]|nr:DUF3667 domain-containing protein [Alteromonadaceae bacterium]